MSDTLPVMEHFYTIQGEGFYTGTPAYFIRLGGCDVGCVWCDVKESWDMQKHPRLSVTEITEKVLQTKAKVAVITGGEPCMHQLDNLTDKLIANQIKTNLETSGAYPITGAWNWICLSPKKFKPPLLENLQVANELKVIIYNQSDFKWAELHAKSVNENCLIYMQPEWDKSKTMLPLIIDYIKENPQWKISLQTHKFMNIP